MAIFNEEAIKRYKINISDKKPDEKELSDIDNDSDKNVHWPTNTGKGDKNRHRLTN